MNDTLTKELETQVQKVQSLISDYCRLESVGAQGWMMGDRLECEVKVLGPA